jgi:hypothetical protein
MDKQARLASLSICAKQSKVASLDVPVQALANMDGMAIMADLDKQEG